MRHGEDFSPRELVHQPAAGSDAASRPIRPRILHLITDGFGGHGGISRFNRDFQTAAVESGAQVVCLPRLGDGPAPLPAGLEYRWEAVGGYSRYGAACLSALSEEHGVDLLICGHLNLLPIAALMKRRWRCPLWLQIYGVEAWARPARLGRFGLRAIDRVLTISEFTAGGFASWSGIANGRVVTIPPTVGKQTVSAACERPVDLLRRYGLEGAKVVLTVSRISRSEPEKGHARVLRALPELARRVPRVKYLVVGSGDGMEDLREAVRRMGLGEIVVFAGRVPDERLPDHYALADAFVLPSTQEGFGIVFLEAAAAGVPVVAGDRDASAEVVAANGLGAVVDPDDPAALAEAIVGALERGRGATPSGLAKFSWERFAENVARVLDEVRPLASK